MRIDERLNLVLPLYRESGADAEPYAWIHSTPISREMFESSFRLLTRTFSALVAEGLAGVRVAHLFLQEAAQSMAGEKPEADRLAAPLLNEMRRLSNVALATAKGWEQMPLQDALDRRLIDADDIPEVMSALTFFTSSWHMHPKATRADFLGGGARMWGAQISSSDATAFFASLPTSTGTASGGEKAAPAATSVTLTDATGRTSTSSLPV